MSKQAIRELQGGEVIYVAIAADFAIIKLDIQKTGVVRGDVARKKHGAIDGKEVPTEQRVPDSAARQVLLLP